MARFWNGYLNFLLHNIKIQNKKIVEKYYF